MITPSNTNRLFPVFLKLETLNLLLIGGGFVALEKLTALLNNAPATNIRVIAKEFSEEFVAFALPYQQVTLIERTFEEVDLNDVDLVITALNDVATSRQIFELAHHHKILINSADKPELCDFYLGSVVQKGNLKIAISTNGKSPTLAKRLKELLQHIIPDEIEDTLENLHAVREQLRGDIQSKIKCLNELTKGLIKR